MSEPTSGLDSVTAYSLVALLKKITRSGCTVIVTIHQPQSKLFFLFDRLMLLKSGRILFQGSIPAALQLFSDCGFAVPHYSNPADHLLDVLTPPLNADSGSSAPEPEEDETMCIMVTGASGKEDSKRGGKEGATDATHLHALDKDALEHDMEHLGLTVSLSRALASRSAQSFSRGLELEQMVSRVKQSQPKPPLVRTASQRPDEANEAMLISKFQQPEVDLGFGLDKPRLNDREPVPWVRQFRILMHRNLKEAWRKRSTLVTSMLQTIIMAVFISTVFLRIGTSQSSTTRRQPVLFFLCVNMGMFGAMSIINSFPSERALMLRERAAGTYYVSAYFLAKSTVDTLISLPLPIVFSVITYWLSGLQPVASKFVIFIIFMILSNLSATSLALMISALCKTTELSVTVLPMVLELARLFGAYFLPPINMPMGFRWIDALSYVNYAYVGVSQNELNGLDLYCKPDELVDGRCPITSGQQTIDALGLDYISIGGCIGVLCGYIIFCRGVAYLAIKYIKSLA